MYKFPTTSIYASVDDVYGEILLVILESLQHVFGDTCLIDLSVN